MIWLFNIILIVFFIFLDNDTSRELAGYFYFVQYISFIVSIYLRTSNSINILYLFTPTFISITYISFTFGLAAIYLNAELGFLQKFVIIYHNIYNFKFINAYFLFCNILLFYIFYINFRKIKVLLISNIKPRKLITFTTLVVSIIIFIIFSFIDLDAGLFGGQGSLSLVPKFISSIIIALFLSSSKTKFRYIYYILLIGIFLASNFESKREIFFLIIVILFIEFYYNSINIRFQIKTVATTLATGLLALSIIISASIARGYGDFKIDSPLDALALVPEYIKSDFFLDAIGENLELNYAYGNALNAADLYLIGETELLYGETFAKVLFVPLPRSIFDYKPRSIVEIYSPLINGGTGEIQPVIIYSELLWNFSILFFIPLFIIFWFSDRIYIKLIKVLKDNTIATLTIIRLFFIGTFLQFVRGSGIDLVVVYLLIGVPFAFLFETLNKLKYNGK